MEEKKALEELRSDPSSRGAFLKIVGGAGAAGALGIFLAACGDDEEKDKAAQSGQDTAAKKDSGTGDAAIVNYALTLEYLEAAFYAEAISRGALSGDVLQFARTAGAHETAHVEFLRDALGSAAVASPTFDFKGTTSATGSFLNTAVVLEDTGVAAYLGQSYRFSSTRLTLIAAHVLVVEARHAAWVRFLTPGRIPAEDAFNGTTFQNGVPRGGYATMPQVLRAAGGFITS